MVRNDRDAGSVLGITLLFVRHLRTTHQQILKACAWTALPLNKQQAPVLDPLALLSHPHTLKTVPLSPCLAVSDSAAYHHQRRPSATKIGLSYSLPSSSHSFASSLLWRMPANFPLASSGLWKCSKFSVPTSILFSFHCNRNPTV